jgi:iron complex outermembrane recepter protein
MSYIHANRRSRINRSSASRGGERIWQEVVLCCWFLGTVQAWADTNELVTSTEELKQMSLEQLMEQQVTLVSRRPEKWFTSPSAEQVITGEDIWRSGATRLPEALRLAPNLQVAQIDSANWAISARGFNRGSPVGSGPGFSFGLTDKLLVLMDGRTLYTPLFGGVLWDVQDTMLEDIDRIEVISGPGGALWGANAVNGVVNIVSKSAKDTQGALLTAGGGTQLRDFTGFRYGGTLASNVFLRVYGKYFDRNSTELGNGVDATNSWRMGQAGFRMDWLPVTGDTVTFQGDGYANSMEQFSAPDTTANGNNLLGRWMHGLGEDSDFTLQMYWDRTGRTFPGVASETENTFDMDFQHRFPIGERQQFIWGGGYRLVADNISGGPFIAFVPPSRNLQLFSGLVQDEFSLVPDRWRLTLGARLEHNDYSGFEFEPNARLSWTPNDRQTFWGAISRAVRSPSRIERDLFVHLPPLTLLGSSQADSEHMLAYELGYRIRPVPRLVLSLATFYNQYGNLHSLEPSPTSPTTLVSANGLEADSWGAEFSGTYQVTDRWRLRGGYTYFNKNVTLKPGSQDFTRGTSEGNDPQNQFLLQSTLDLPFNLQLDWVARYVDTLPTPNVPSYFAMDVRLAWKVRRNLELAIVGQNLWDERHAEFGAAAIRQEIPRSVYGKITWQF